LRLTQLKNFLLVPLLILIVGLFGAIYAKQHVTEKNKSIIQQSLGSELSKILVDSEAAIRKYEYGIRGIRGSVDTVGIDNYDYQTQLKYFKSRDYANEFPGARGFGVIKKVAASDLEQFLQKARDERGGNFNVKQLDSPADPLFIIQYIEPEDNNKLAVGLDIGSEYFRRQAALLSATSRTTQLTGPITLVQATDKVKHGFLLLHPIFKINEQTSLEELAGWAYAPLLIHEILDVVYAESGDISIIISDVTTPTVIDFYGGFSSEAKGQNAGVSGEVDVFGRRWLISLTPNDSFFTKLPLENEWRIFWQILILACLIAILGLVLSFYSRQRLAELKQRISLASVIDNASDGVIALNNNFAIDSWNKAAEQMFGFVTPDSRNQPLINWLSGALATDKVISVYKQVANKQTITNLNIKYQSPTGDSERYFALNFSPIHIKDQFAGVTLTIHDATEIVNLQNELVQTNMTLQRDVSRKSDELLGQISFEETILNNTNLAIFKSSPSGLVTLFNQMATELLGYKAVEVVEKVNVISFLNSSDFPMPFPDKKIPDDFIDKMLSSSENPKYVSTKCTLKHKSGDDISTQLIVAPIYKSGKLDSLLFIANDETFSRQQAKQLELIRTAVDTSNDLMLWLKVDGDIFFCNPHAQKALALNNPSQRITNIKDFLQLGEGESWDSICQNIIRDGQLTFEAKFKRPGNLLLPKLVSACVMTIENEPVIYLAAKNILELVEKERQLKAALAKAAKASDAKSYFISNMSHEIRTPLNAINGCLQLLESKALSDSDRSHLVLAKQAVRSLTDTVDDILEFSSFDDKLTVIESDIELDSLLNHVGDYLYSQVKNKPVEVHYLVEEDVPHFVKTDGAKLKRILQSLGSNAIKFTSKGEVVIRIFVIETTDNGQIRLGISVKDTGIGIAKEDVSAIFEMFNQLDNSNSREFGGLGLGLTIASKYVHLLGGEITVTSTLGQGSEFNCDVWVSAASSDKTIKLPLLDKQICALLVDDNKTSLQILSDTLSQLKWKITATSDPNDALTLYQSARNHGEPFDIAILDWKMPGTDGWELADAIRKITPVEDTPLILMVTAHNKEEMAEKFQQNPCLLNGFLTKPVTRSQIFHAYFDAVSVSHNLPENVVSSDKPLAGIRVLVVEDNPTNQQIVRELLEGQGASITVAAGGLQALTELGNSLLSYDVVLMDIQMPDIDGYETTQRIKSQERFKALPIIAMTANVLPSDKEKCYEVGMAGHISKPFEIKELVSAILQTLAQPDKNSSQIETVDDGLSLSVPVVRFCQSEGIEIQSAMARFNNQEAIYCRSLNLFISDLKLYREQLLSDELDNTELKRLFHTLKSTSGSLGFASLSQYAKEHEQGLSDDNVVLLSSEKIKGICDKLVIACEQSEMLKTLMSATDAIDTRPVVYTEFTSAFSTLKEEVQNFNMHALETLLLVLPELKRTSSDLADKLVVALDKLKFKEARLLLTKLEKVMGNKDAD
jgi:PAS domain S-box-containing protein